MPGSAGSREAGGRENRMTGEAKRRRSGDKGERKDKGWVMGRRGVLGPRRTAQQRRPRARQETGRCWAASAHSRLLPLQCAAVDTAALVAAGGAHAHDLRSICARASPPDARRAHTYCPAPPLTRVHRACRITRTRTAAPGGRPTPRQTGCRHSGRCGVRRRALGGRRDEGEKGVSAQWPLWWATPRWAGVGWRCGRR